MSDSLPARPAHRHPGLNLLEKRLQIPMLLLSFVWFFILITELVRGGTPLLSSLGTIIWILFIVYFCLRLATVAKKTTFLKKNWLFILAILASILRLVPFLQVFPLARILTATFGMQVLWIFVSADVGMRSLRRTLGPRGVGYALTFTLVVISAGAAGMLYFEKNAPDPQGIHSYPKALWWAAMQITNIGSGYRPSTSGGQILCLGISIYAAAMFGYLTALLATILVGHDAEDPKSEIASQKSILKLHEEVALLRKSVESALRHLPPA
jgi:voltage-gated potassium channel